jgi:hypothetical protein
MKNRALSSRTERAPRPWYRERWPALLAAGPAAVVVASLCTAWIAVKSDDGLVAEDYYKRGLLINQKLKQSAPSSLLNLGATVRVAQNGDIRARLQGLPDATGAPPSTIRLRLVQPAQLAPARIVNLRRDENGDYLGVLAEQAPGRWIVGLESDAWRLPTTTVAGRWSEVRLGAAAARP